MGIEGRGNALRSDVFCTEKIYENIFFETKDFLVVYDKRPILPGHTLIIPKRHVSQIIELTDAELVSLRETLKLVIPKLLDAYGADSYNISINAGEQAGMVIDHLHFHLVPRKSSDAFQGNVAEFYRVLQSERIGYIKNVAKEIERLRRIFKYKTQ